MLGSDKAYDLVRVMIKQQVLHCIVRGIRSLILSVIQTLTLSLTLTVNLTQFLNLTQRLRFKTGRGGGGVQENILLEGVGVELFSTCTWQSLNQ